MPFVLFFELCPEVARGETRTITVTPAAKFDLPVGEYHFVELYCNEKNCDCRRVLFSVMSGKRTEAVINWGWEDLAFYKRWLGDSDLEMAREMKGPNLNLMSPQSENAAKLLFIAQGLLLADPDYTARIKRHYELFRSVVDRPAKNKRHVAKNHKSPRKRR